MADFDAQQRDDQHGDGPHGDGPYPGVDRLTYLEQIFRNVVK